MRFVQFRVSILFSRFSFSSSFGVVRLKAFSSRLVYVFVKRYNHTSLASTCVELVCIHANYQYDTQHAGCEALSAVSLYTDVFVSGFDLDPNEHIRHTF